MEIENGGKAVASAANIGQFAGSSGAILVRGADSRLEVANSLTVGNLGAGALNVQSGGVVTAANVTVSSVSSLNLSGSSVVQSSIDNHGLLSVFDSSVTGGVTLRADSTMSFDNATISSLTHQAGADLLVMLRSTNDFDNLNVTGAVSLAGDLVVSLGVALVPAPGQSFDILDWSSLSGTFANVTLPTLASNLAWNTSQLYTTGVLSIVGAGLPGDYNSDGTVNAADYTVWRDNVGTTVVLPNDPTGGTIGSTQYNTWRSNFAASAGALLVPSTSVPEPASAVMLALALASYAGRRSRSWIEVGIL